MTAKFIRKFFPLLAIPFLVTCSGVHTHSSNNDIINQDADQEVRVWSSITSDITNVQEPAISYNSGIPKVQGYVESKPDKEFPFQLYITPEDQAIKALAVQINGAEDAYKVAVNWTYVSEQKLNQVADKWLTPQEFLANTPHYLGNPLKGKEVSDCEEQANTLVSLIRAEGVRPEEVRVALGEVTFNNVETGHAWVELLTNGQWVALDPSWGPYWDDKAEKLVRRQGLPFDYYNSHIYPVLQVWAYYSDIYYLDPRDSSGNAPALWRKTALVK